MGMWTVRGWKRNLETCGEVRCPGGNWTPQQLLILSPSPSTATRQTQHTTWILILLSSGNRPLHFTTTCHLSRHPTEYYQDQPGRSLVGLPCDPTSQQRPNTCAKIYAQPIRRAKTTLLHPLTSFYLLGKPLSLFPTRKQGRFQRQHF